MNILTGAQGGMMKTEKNMMTSMRPDLEHLTWDKEETGFQFHSQVCLSLS